MSRGLVLGAGAHAGYAWVSGLIIGLRRAGVDLAGADVLVGTSTTAFAGVMTALTASGEEMERIVTELAERRQRLPMAEIEGEQFFHMIGTVADDSPQGAERRREIGQMAMRSNPTLAIPRWDAVVGGMPSKEWPPDLDLLLPTVEVESGERVVWRRGGAAAFPDAVRAATAVPTVFPPVGIGGRHYMDGTAYSFSNADLAAGLDHVLVFMPLRSLLSDTALDRELAALDPRRSTLISPDADTVEAFKTGLFDPRIWITFFHTGQRQAAAQAEEIAAAWNA